MVTIERPPPTYPLCHWRLESFQQSHCTRLPNPSTMGEWKRIARISDTKTMPGLNLLLLLFLGGIVGKLQRKCCLLRDPDILANIMGFVADWKDCRLKWRRSNEKNNTGSLFCEIPKHLFKKKGGKVERLSSNFIPWKVRGFILTSSSVCLNFSLGITRIRLSCRQNFPTPGFPLWEKWLVYAGGFLLIIHKSTIALFSHKKNGPLICMTKLDKFLKLLRVSGFDWQPAQRSWSLEGLKST